MNWRRSSWRYEYSIIQLSARGDYSLERCLGFFDLNMDNEVDE